MTSLWAPMLAILFSIAAFEPWPISVMAMTAATPIITPRAVRVDRSLLRRKLPKAVRSVGGRNDPAADFDRTGNGCMAGCPSAAFTAG